MPDTKPNSLPDQQPPTNVGATPDPGDTPAAQAPDWLPKLAEILKPHQLSTSPSVLDQHSHDESYHTPHRPDVVVFPESEADVVAVMKFAKTHQLAVTPFGVGSALEGHVVPLRGGITLDMLKMNRIVEIRPDDFLVCVEPGVTRVELNEALRQYGLFFPIDPGANASIGGMAATNASGTTTVRYGAMKDNVRSLRVVLEDGSAIRSGSLAAKSSSGYNLTPLFVGSEGTLGVFTQIWLKLSGIPERTLAARAIFETVEEAVNAATAMVGSGVPVARVEYVSTGYLEAFNRIAGTSYAVKPTLFLEFSGAAAALDPLVNLAHELATDEGCVEWTAVSGEADRAQLWSVRHNSLHTFMRQYPGYQHMATDVCVPLSKLAGAVAHAETLVEKHNIAGAIIGHVGDGNFHVSLAVRPENKEEMDRAYALNEELVDYALSVEGTCTGEHGVGLGKRKYQAKEHGPALAVMQAIKAALDPDDRLNPGKLVDG